MAFATCVPTTVIARRVRRARAVAARGRLTAAEPAAAREAPAVPWAVVPVAPVVERSEAGAEVREVARVALPEEVVVQQPVFPGRAPVPAVRTSGMAAAGEWTAASVPPGRP